MCNKVCPAYGAAPIESLLTASGGSAAAFNEEDLHARFETLPAPMARCAALHAALPDHAHPLSDARGPRICRPARPYRPRRLAFGPRQSGARQRCPWRVVPPTAQSTPDQRRRAEHGRQRTGGNPDRLDNAAPRRRHLARTHPCRRRAGQHLSAQRAQHRQARLARDGARVRAEHAERPHHGRHRRPRCEHLPRRSGRQRVERDGVLRRLALFGERRRSRHPARRARRNMVRPTDALSDLSARQRRFHALERCARPATDGRCVVPLRVAGNDRRRRSRHLWRLVGHAGIRRRLDAAYRGRRLGTVPDRPLGLGRALGLELGRA